MMWFDRVSERKQKTENKMIKHDYGHSMCESIVPISFWF